MDAIPVYDSSGQKVDSVELSEAVFAASIDEHLVHQAVVMQRASARQGTASTKGRGEVRGSGKKPWKQKHTGRARAGSAGSPIWRSGGTVFGPKPRSYSYQLPKKVYRAALRSALAAKVSSGDLIVADLALSEMKTKELMRQLTQVGAVGKIVLVIEESLVDIIRIGKNVKLLKVLHATDLNVYDLLWCEKLVVSRGELTKIQECWV